MEMHTLNSLTIEELGLRYTAYSHPAVIDGECVESCGILIQSSAAEARMDDITISRVEILELLDRLYRNMALPSELTVLAEDFLADAACISAENMVY